MFKKPRGEDSSITRSAGVAIVTGAGWRCHRASVDADMAVTLCPSPREQGSEKKGAVESGRRKV